MFFTHNADGEGVRRQKKEENSGMQLIKNAHGLSEYSRRRSGAPCAPLLHPLPPAAHPARRIAQLNFYFINIIAYGGATIYNKYRPHKVV